MQRHAGRGQKNAGRQRRNREKATAAVQRQTATNNRDAEAGGPRRQTERRQTNTQAGRRPSSTTPHHVTRTHRHSRMHASNTITTCTAAAAAAGLGSSHNILQRRQAGSMAGRSGDTNQGRQLRGCIAAAPCSSTASCLDSYITIQAVHISNHKPLNSHSHNTTTQLQGRTPPSSDTRPCPQQHS